MFLFELIDFLYENDVHIALFLRNLTYCILKTRLTEEFGFAYRIEVPTLIGQK